MKVLFVCKSLPHTYLGGIQTHVWKLSEWMLLLGHDVSILTAGTLRNGIRHIEMGGRNIIELPYLPGRKLPLMSVVAEESTFNLAAKNWLLKNQSDYDVIHLQGRSGNLFLKDKEKVTTPVVNTLHGLISVEYQRVGEKPRWTIDRCLHRLFATRMENYALQNADALIAVSNEMKAEIEARDSAWVSKTKILYNGVDTQASPDQVTTDPNMLLFVGRLTAIKGVFPLVEAMQNVHERIRLVMVGDGEARPEIEQLIKQYKLEDRITLTGGLCSKEVMALMHRCSALVLPSFHETQGIVLLEANACGKPVIANAVGGVMEVVKDGKSGWLLEGNEPGQISSGINKLFNKPQEAEAMGKWAREHIVPNFSWEKIARETLGIYEKLISQPAHEYSRSMVWQSDKQVMLPEFN